MEKTHRYIYIIFGYRKIVSVKDSQKVVEKSFYYDYNYYICNKIIDDEILVR